MTSSGENLAIPAARRCRTRSIALAVAVAGALAHAPIAQADEVAPVSTARFAWSMPDRYEAGWQAWDAQASAYRPGYVQPRRWTLQINACRSSGGGQAIDLYRFSIRGVDTPFTLGTHGTACRRTFKLEHLGRYDVSVTVRTAAGESAPRTQRIRLRDWLIVSTGDSMASGEGTPDEPGDYRFGGGAASGLQEVRPVTWQDKRCHRSARSGHALAAAKLERDDPYSSVTFVSLACSGAEIRHLLTDGYAGQQPTPGDTTTLPAQLDRVAEVIGPRRVDAMLLSVGVNDIDFAGIIRDCATNLGPGGLGDSDCVTDADGIQNMDALEGRYDALGARLRSLAIDEVYMTDYPSWPFGDGSGGGCQSLLGIRPIEAQQIGFAGLRLRALMRAAALRNGWNFSDGMTEEFREHHMCATDNYLTRYGRSWADQGTEDGTAHPNRAGYTEMARILNRAIVLGRPLFPRWHARVTIEQVRVPIAARASLQVVKDPVVPPGGETGETVPGNPAAPVLKFEFAPAGSTMQTTFKQLPITPTGGWADVPPGAVTYAIDLWDAPRPPRYPTGIEAVVRGPAGNLQFGNPGGPRFGAGRHEVTSPTGFGLRYRIDVRRLQPLNSPGADPDDKAATPAP